MTAKRNSVSTYRRKGTFRAQHAERTSRAAQTTALPPRCVYCRLPGIHMINGEPRCNNHIHIGEGEKK